MYGVIQHAPYILSLVLPRNLQNEWGSHMFHLAAFGGAKTDSTANQNVPATATEQALSVSSNARYISPKKVKVFAAYAQNDTLASARINAPSLRNLGLPAIYPFNPTAAAVAAGPIDYRGDDGVEIQATEEFGVDASNGVSTVDFAEAGLWFRDQIEPIPAGKRFTIEGTATITGVRDAWVNGTITLGQILPFGTYAVIGMYCTGAAITFARLVFPFYSYWRPGCLASPTAGGAEPLQIFRHGKVGSWGQFISTSQPTLEIFVTTAGAVSPIVGLDLVAVNVPQGI
jgi:hypothetical protein